MKQPIKKKAWTPPSIQVLKFSETRKLEYNTETDSNTQGPTS